MGLVAGEPGTFDVEHQDTGVEIVADSRFDWTGWLELAKEPVDEVATNMTAQVILDVNADIQGVVEVEDRPSLSRFNQDLLGGHFAHVMLIDGNDSRGIDVGIMTKGGVEIVSMQSNVDVADPGAPGERLFSRDCAEYLCRLPSSETVRVLLNHFKSQSGGGGEKRARQAQGVRDIVDALVASGEKNLVVMGDLNEGPDGQGNPSTHFAPLYAPSSPLVDVFSLPAFDPGPKPGTFQSCSTTNRIDYIFVSKNLAPKVSGWRNRATRPVGNTHQQEPAAGLGDLPRHHELGPGSLRPRSGLRRHRHLIPNGVAVLQGALRSNPGTTLGHPRSRMRTARWR